ncbi:MAG: nitroreductase family protein [Bacteroidales bacterium]|nr:nitroreductase family protein [Bacteroidales bacterium]HOY38626.1 nitroreductase family protein [Bacteroidales bacterium]HQP04580.1 nitroreductase family protein [Bacteroidales bacterium]
MEKTAIFQYPVIDIIQKRWSPVLFDGKTISEQQANTLVEAAMWAPSAYNEQPWRYIVAHKGSEKFDKILAALIEFNHAWAKEASLLVVSLAKKIYSHDGKPNYHYMYDTGAANAFMINQATSMGIFSHSMGGIYYDKMRELFAIPEELEICSVIAFGYHSEASGANEQLLQREQQPRMRKAMKDVVLHK